MVITGITFLALFISWKHTIDINPYYDSLSFEQRQQIRMLSPEQVIRMYYDAINEKNDVLRLALLSPSYLRGPSTFKRFLKGEYRKTAEEWKRALKESHSSSKKVSIVSITRSKSELRAGLPPLPPGEIQIEVYQLYDSKLKWPDLYFFNLSKSPYDGHWQIDSGGTSP